MYLWDTNVLNAFIHGNNVLSAHVERTPWTQIALPSVVVAEVLRGRADGALKAEPQNATRQHKQLIDAKKLIDRFQVIVFDEPCAKVLMQLRQKHRRSKRYADMMIAATALARQHIVVTRNTKDFRDLLPNKQLVNWVD